MFSLPNLELPDLQSLKEKAVGVANALPLNLPKMPANTPNPLAVFKDQARGLLPKGGLGMPNPFARQQLVASNPSLTTGIRG